MISSARPDRRQRVAQLVGEHREELVLALVGLLGARARLSLDLVQPRVLDRQCGAIRQVLQQGAIIVGERVVVVVARGGDRAQRPPARLERDREQAADAQRLDLLGDQRRGPLRHLVAAPPTATSTAFPVSNTFPERPSPRRIRSLPATSRRCLCRSGSRSWIIATSSHSPSGEARAIEHESPTWARTSGPMAFRTEATSRLAAARIRDASASTRRRAVDRRSRSARSARCSACAHCSATTRRKATFGASNVWPAPKESPRAPIHTSSATSGTAAHEPRASAPGVAASSGYRWTSSSREPTSTVSRVANRVGHRQVGRQREAGPRPGGLRLVTAGVRDLQRRTVRRQQENDARVRVEGCLALRDGLLGHGRRVDHAGQTRGQALQPIGPLDGPAAFGPDRFVHRREALRDWRFDPQWVV